MSTASNHATLATRAAEATLALAILDALDVVAIAIDDGGAVLYQNALARQLSPPLVARLAARASDAQGAPDRRALAVDIDGERWRGWAWALSPQIVVGVARRTQPERSVTEAVAAALGVGVAEARLAVRVARGLSNQRIAESLGVPVGTLNTRLWRLYRRLGVENRADLAARVGHVAATCGGPTWELEPPEREVEM